MHVHIVYIHVAFIIYFITFMLNNLKIRIFQSLTQIKTYLSFLQLFTTHWTWFFVNSTRSIKLFVKLFIVCKINSQKAQFNFYELHYLKFCPIFDRHLCVRFGFKTVVPSGRSSERATLFSTLPHPCYLHTRYLR